jgi:hypothetical protein
MEINPEFGTFDALLKIVAEPAAFKARMTELRDKLAEVASAEKKLAADRQGFEETRKKVIAELEQDRATLSKKLQTYSDPRAVAWLHTEMKRRAAAELNGDAA